MKITSVTVERGFTIQAGNHFVKAGVLVSAKCDEMDDVEENIDQLDQLAQRKVLEAINRGLDELEVKGRGKDPDSTSR